MTVNELQIAADTAWMVLGPDGFGVSVSEEAQSRVLIDVAGTADGIFYVFNQSFWRHEVENARGHEHFNYIRQVVNALRQSVSDIHKAQIVENLGT
jgi:hypothetical protein